MRQTRPACIWSIHDPSAETEQDIVKPGTGAARVYGDFPEMLIRPKFSIPKDAKFFTSGSCFARNMERAFIADGFSVLSWAQGSGVPSVEFNRYTTHTIIYDFMAAIDGFDDRLVWQVRPDRWVDYAGHSVAPTREALNDTRRRIHSVFRRFTEAEVIVVTLGLVEAWYDRELNAYLNFAPAEMLVRNPDRFELRITDYPENRRAMERLYQTLDAHMRRDWKMIVTVSPVPFNVTYSGQDVIAANTYSKSTLRAVAEDFAADHDNVAYWPSYELVTLASPAAAWTVDRRHVQQRHVDQIIAAFRNVYIER